MEEKPVRVPSQKGTGDANKFRRQNSATAQPSQQSAIKPTGIFSDRRGSVQMKERKSSNNRY